MHWKEWQKGEYLEKMVKTAIEKGVKYWNPKNGTYNYVLENGFASRKHLIVGQNSVSGYITTVVKQSKLPKGLIRLGK